MRLKNKNIGIWGFGATGQATARFVHAHGGKVTIMDRNPQPNCPWPFLQENEKNRDTFLADAEIIIPSPGIDITPYYQQYKSKWLSELDLFAHYNQIPIIAITGSLGKTSTTTLLSDLLRKYGLLVKTGGNIGTPVLDLLADGAKPDAILLEVSSFQLEHTTRFNPTIAVLTNLHENHLDRHGSMTNYVAAKCKMFSRQSADQIAIVPLEHAAIIRQHAASPSFRFTSSHLPGTQELRNLPPSDAIFYMDGSRIVDHRTREVVLDLSTLPPLTFRENWLTICAVLNALDLPLGRLAYHARDLKLPPHRLESVPFRPGIFVYNDSKSTTPASTSAAIAQLDHPNTILFLGGLSKGIDRTPFIKNLARRVKQIYCFGSEASCLHTACQKCNIPSRSFATLEEAWRHCTAQVQPGNAILFSPAGSSFDLFKNYEDRGKAFKKLVTESR